MLLMTWATRLRRAGVSRSCDRLGIEMVHRLMRANGVWPQLQWLGVGRKATSGARSGTNDAERKAAGQQTATVVRYAHAAEAGRALRFGGAPVRAEVGRH